jgi:hypothetical protein
MRNYQLLKILLLFLGLFNNAGFQVLTAVSTKMAVFRVLAPCSLVDVYHCFRGSCCLHHHRPDDGGSKDLWNVGKLLPDEVLATSNIIALMMEAARTSETLVNFYQTRFLLPPTSSPWLRQQEPLTHWYTSTRLHGATTQKTAISVFNNAFNSFSVRWSACLRTNSFIYPSSRAYVCQL